MILEPKIWKLCMLIATEVSLLMPFSVDRLGKQPLYIILAFHYFYLCRSIPFVDYVGWVSLGGQVELECAWAAGLPRDKLYWKLKL